MAVLLPWPDLTGARDTAGRVCVGVSSRKSRSAACRTYLRFYDPGTRVEVEELATKVRWAAGRDVATQAILLRGIHDVLVQKGALPFDRGTLVPRLIGCRFYLLEAYRSMLWPRYKWWLPYNLGWENVLDHVLWYETLRPDVVVAEEDKRPPGEELVTPWADHDVMSKPVRHMGSFVDFVDELLEVRGIPRREGR